MTWSSTATRGVTGPRRPLRGLGGFGSLAFSIPLGLSAGRPLSPFSRAISARWAATVCSRAATLPSNRTTSAFSSVRESASRSPGGAIPPENQRQACQGSENHAAATRFAAVTEIAAKSLKTMARPKGFEPLTCILEAVPTPDQHTALANRLDQVVALAIPLNPDSTLVHRDLN